MVNQEKTDFLKEEVLCDHLVTAKIKLLWATQLDCLKELQDICKRHHIKYYASGGTLLGAVRHKGFIPWDDDLDVVMPYEDYLKFCDVAKKELPSPYFFQNYQTEEGFGPGMSRIRNSNTTCCTSYEQEIVTEGYNCGVFIDIFPLFNVEKSSLRLFFQKCLILFWRLGIAGYEKHRKAILTGNRRKILHPVVFWWKFLHIFMNHQQVSKKYLDACAMANLSDRVGLLSFSGFDKKWIWQKCWYHEMVELPFEYTEIACPKGYDLVLKQQFGNYMKFVKGGSVHTLAICEPDKPYREIMKDYLLNRKR